MGESVALPPSIVSVGASQTQRGELQPDANVRDVRGRNREAKAEAEASEVRQLTAARGERLSEDQETAALRGRLSISLDADTQTMIYRSVDPDSGSVMWQWPAEQTLRMVKFLRDLEGLDKAEKEPKALDRKV